MKEIDYVKVGDYYIPALTVPDKRYNIGKYGMLRRTFLCLKTMRHKIISKISGIILMRA